ncbi:MAG: LacI family DNA-binding transcriptional regulator [Anaerolineae bacterium]|nr:LacI family DNA-binding transcriptional regulator [Anaerolineae bacterium]
MVREQSHMVKPDSNVTIIDVAREAGVSNSTVSRVVNNSELVKPETREKVLNAMMRLGYVVNQQARSLRGGRSQVVGVLVPDVGNSYIGEIIRGIDAELAANQYDLLLYTTHRRKTKESTHVATITRGLADGLLLLLPTNVQAYMESLQAQQFPHVLIDYQAVDNKWTSTIQSTNWQGAYDATQYLIELGHRRIGYVVGLREMQCSLDRLAGYRAALADYAIPFDPALVYYGDFYLPEGYDATTTLLQASPPPTAIFAANDLSALGVMEAIRSHGLSIPNDISVIGFDDIPDAAQFHPSLTTVRQPLEDMGRLAVRTLLKRLANPDLHGERVELPTELIVRNSCKSVNHK